MRADYLSKMVGEELGALNPSVMIEHLPAPAIDRDAMMDITTANRWWIDDIKDYIENGVMPEDRALARVLQKRAARYSVQDGTLYRMSRVLPLLRCVRPKEIKGILTEIHQGVCRGGPT